MELLNDLAQTSILGLLLAICLIALAYLYRESRLTEKQYQEKLENEQNAHLQFAKEILTSNAKSNNDFREILANLVSLIKGRNE